MESEERGSANTEKGMRMIDLTVNGTDTLRIIFTRGRGKFWRECGKQQGAAAKEPCLVCFVKNKKIKIIQYPFPLFRMLRGLYTAECGLLHSKLTVESP